MFETQETPGTEKSSVFLSVVVVVIMLAAILSQVTVSVWLIMVISASIGLSPWFVGPVSFLAIGGVTWLQFVVAAVSPERVAK